MRHPKSFAVLIAIVCCAALGGCARGTNPSGQDPRLFGQWKLVSAADLGGTIALPAATITLTLARGQTPHGRGPCSDYSARIVGSPGPVFVKVTRRTAIYCADTSLRSTETRYLEALNATTIASVARGDLTLAGLHTKLRYEPIASVDLASVVDKTWFAQTIIVKAGRITSILDAPRGINLRFAADYSFVVNTLCSSPTGSWSVDAGEVVLSRIQNADSACPRADERDRDLVMRIMAHGITVGVRARALTVTNPRTQETIFFTRTPPIDG